jgi:uncharacterized protein (TIGR00255 family)
MIRSMTGFGAASLEEGDGAARAGVAIRSLNHRYLEIAVSLPKRIASIEPDVKALVQSRLRRGKVDVSVRATFTRDDAGGMVVASQPVVSGLVKALRQIRDDHGLSGDVTIADVARFPGALEVVEAPDSADDDSGDVVLPLVARALDGLDAMRRAEGERLTSELCERLAAISAAAESLERQSEQSRGTRRAALLDKVGSLTKEMGLDETRLYQEVVRLVDRSDVAEELQRLQSHVAQCRSLVGDEAPAGKRLDFLAQELMREANTVGSKAASAPMAQAVVSLKAEIERFREQVQNVE